MRGPCPTTSTHAAPAAHGGWETQGAWCSRAFLLHQPFMSCCQEAAAHPRSLLSALTAFCPRHLHKRRQGSDL